MQIFSFDLDNLFGRFRYRKIYTCSKCGEPYSAKDDGRVCGRKLGVEKTCGCAPGRTYHAPASKDKVCTECGGKIETKDVHCDGIISRNATEITPD